MVEAASADSRLGAATSRIRLGSCPAHGFWFPTTRSNLLGAVQPQRIYTN